MGAQPLDVVCIGEALVDFLPDKPGQAVSAVEHWHRCSGGSPANVAVGLSRLGARSAMVGVVGQDAFGDFLVESLAREGVDVSRMRQTGEGKTGLVFISLAGTGERSFAFFRTRSAELFLSDRDADPAFLGRARAIHCGTNSLLFPDARKAMLEMARAAAAAGKIVSCDPNLRLHFWPDPQQLRQLLDALIPSCTVVKLAEDELEFVTGETRPEGALSELRRRGVALPVVTLGERGAAFLWGGEVVQVPARPARVLDATGAGDAFVSGLLYGLTRLFPDRAALLLAGPGELRELVGFGCALGARAVERLGAVAGLPRQEEIRPELPPALRRA